VVVFCRWQDCASWRRGHAQHGLCAWCRRLFPDSCFLCRLSENECFQRLRRDVASEVNHLFQGRMQLRIIVCVRADWSGRYDGSDTERYCVIFDWVHLRRPERCRWIKSPAGLHHPSGAHIFCDPDCVLIPPFRRYPKANGLAGICGMPLASARSWLERAPLIPTTAAGHEPLGRADLGPSLCRHSPNKGGGRMGGPELGEMEPEPIRKEPRPRGAGARLWVSRGSP
jgi:hypothetical protein